GAEVRVLEAGEVVAAGDPQVLDRQVAELDPFAVGGHAGLVDGELARARADGPALLHPRGVVEREEPRRRAGDARVRLGAGVLEDEGRGETVLGVDAEAGGEVERHAVARREGAVAGVVGAEPGLARIARRRGERSGGL